MAGLITGMSFSWKEKIWISMIPSQNTGTEMNRDGSDWSASRSQAERRQAGQERERGGQEHRGQEPERRQGQVAGRLAASWSTTGTPAWTE
jgi:hypothetical protein